MRPFVDGMGDRKTPLTTGLDGLAALAAVESVA